MEVLGTVGQVSCCKAGKDVRTMQGAYYGQCGSTDRGAMNLLQQPGKAACDGRAKQALCPQGIGSFGKSFSVDPHCALYPGSCEAGQAIPKILLPWYNCSINNDETFF